MRSNAAKTNMIDLAHAWLHELRLSPPPDEMPVSEAVVLMNFTAPPADQWTFIVAAVEEARNEDELSHIAAGPLEHLLGHHGQAYIDTVEDLARRNAKFARAVAGVWKYMMTDEVWRRVQDIQRASSTLSDE